MELHSQNTAYALRYTDSERRAYMRSLQTIPLNITRCYSSRVVATARIEEEPRFVIQK